MFAGGLHSVSAARFLVDTNKKTGTASAGEAMKMKRVTEEAMEEPSRMAGDCVALESQDDGIMG